MNKKMQVLSKATEHYLSSGDFNGTPIKALVSDDNIDTKLLISLVEDELLGIVWPGEDINPHILRHGFPNVQDQVEWLRSQSDRSHACVYPRSKHLNTAVDQKQYVDRPFSLELALGEPQLAFRTFDVSVLEIYRNDPRYHYRCNDVGGRISVDSKYAEAQQMEGRDTVLLQTFGFCYDKSLNRGVAAFLRYLSGLSPEHQTIWNARLLKGEYFLHPDYYKSSIQGDFPDHFPILDAFCIELYLINQLANAIGKPKLFKKDFGKYGESRPRKLSLLVRPTLEEFNLFVLLLDKLLSDNINKKFFENDISLEFENVRGNGKIEVHQKGTIRLLDEWMRSQFDTDDWVAWDDSISALHEIRKLRQRPAHAVEMDAFDQEIFRQQRELIKKAYNGVRTIRMMLEKHPIVRMSDIDVPDWLREGRIRAI